ncbi:MAG: cell division protein FtsQ/DivIB [Blautia sp.]|jgi:cell division septal protein FtsQ
MRTSNYHKNLKISKKAMRITAGCLAALVLAGIIAFFVYFHVDTVEVLSSERYTDEEIKEMVLRGPLASNSVLAPMLYSNSVEGVPFVEGFAVRQVNRNTIAISVKEKKPVGCIPFLDCFIYFDRSGRIIESSTERDKKIPYFDGLEVDHVALEEDLAIKEESVLNTAVSLSRIFEKNDMIPDHIYFDDKYQISLEYGTVLVQLGKDSYLEDKMARLIAILPKISDQKGILHMESVTADVKTITFEKEVTAADKKENGEAASDGEQTGEDGEALEGSGEDGSFDQSAEGWEDGDGTEGDSYGQGQEEPDEEEYDPGSEEYDENLDDGNYDSDQESW